MISPEFIDSDEGREYPETACFNCGSTVNLTDIWPDDHDKAVVACHDCADEILRLEAEVRELCALPSCAVRDQIIDRVQTTAQLANALRAHDMACSCSRRKPAQGAAPLREVA